MKFSLKPSLLNVASIGLVSWMIFILFTNPKNQGGYGLSNFFPIVGIIVGGLGLILDQVFQSIIKKTRVNIIGLIIILFAVATLFYILKN